MAKQPQKNKSLHPSPSKSPLKTQDPRIYENMPFRWRTTSQYVDYDEEEWGWNQVTMKRLFGTCIKWLQHYESKTWAQIKEDPHCHPVPLKDIAHRAQKRITDKYRDMDGLYQVKADGKCRLFGRKDGQYFDLIWHDKKHTVYPMGK